MTEPITEQQLREFARQVVLSCGEDIDYMGVAEQHEEAWAHLSPDEHASVHSKVDKLIGWAQVTVTWPDEQDGASDE